MLAFAVEEAWTRDGADLRCAWHQRRLRADCQPLLRIASTAALQKITIIRTDYVHAVPLTDLIQRKVNLVVASYA
jgi:hypothetical protein